MKEVMADAEQLPVAFDHDAMHRFVRVEEPPPGSLSDLVGQRGRTGALVEGVVVVPEQFPGVVVFGTNGANDRRSFLRRHLAGSGFVAAAECCAGTSLP